MNKDWDEKQPIYRQLMDEIVNWILSGKFNDGDLLPSARKVALEFKINPLTAAKAYQELTTVEVLQTKRGIGLYVRPGAQKLLMRSKREHFLKTEIPEIIHRMKLMGIEPEDLLVALKRHS